MQLTIEDICNLSNTNRFLRCSCSLVFYSLTLFLLWGCANPGPPSIESALQDDINALLEQQLKDGEIAEWSIPEEQNLTRNLAVFLTCTEEKRLCRYYYTVQILSGRPQMKVFGRSCRNYMGNWEAVSWDRATNPHMHEKIRKRYLALKGLGSNLPPADYSKATSDGLPPLLIKNLKRAEKKHNLPLGRMVEKASQTNRLNPLLVHAVVNTESAYNPKAKSHVGAIGLMQLMPATARELRVNPYDPEDNLDGGSRYLRQQLDRPGIKGNVALALAAYNAGYGNVTKHGYKVPPFKETQNYVKKILALYDSSGQPNN